MPARTGSLWFPSCFLKIQQNNFLYVKEVPQKSIFARQETQQRWCWEKCRKCEKMASTKKIEWHSTTVNLDYVQSLNASHSTSHEFGNVSRQFLQTRKHWGCNYMLMSSTQCCWYLRILETGVSNATEISSEWFHFLSFCMSFSYRSEMRIL